MRAISFKAHQLPASTFWSAEIAKHRRSIATPPSITIARIKSETTA
jgi:hypothetical protein